MSDKDSFFKYFLFFILCAIWSTTWAMIKIGLDDTPPLIGLSLRFLTASIVMFSIVIITKRKISLDKDLIKLYLIVGVLSQALSYFCTYWGTQYIPSSLASILWVTLPLFVGIFAHFSVEGERLNLSRIFSIVLATVGVVAILSDQKIVFSVEMILGSSIVLFGVFIAAWPSIYVKTFKKHYDPFVLTACAIGIAAVIHTTLSLIFERWSAMVWDFKNIGSFVYLGVLGSATTFMIYYWLIKHIRVVKLSFVTFITPVFACIIGFAFLGEMITFQEIFGVFFIFFGIIIFDWKRYWILLGIGRP